jgi:two-component system cell cycle response regulator
MDERQVDAIERAARVHDIGMIVVSPQILAKHDGLTPCEETEMQRHAAFGARLIAAVGDQEPAAIVRHHHERLDGSGYPDALRGAAIPVGARIVAVCDTYDALTAPRPDREAPTPVAALRLLQDEAGAAFDPAIVAAFAA